MAVLYGNQGLGKKKARDTWREGEPGLSATARDYGVAVVAHTGFEPVSPP